MVQEFLNFYYKKLTFQSMVAGRNKCWQKCIKYLILMGCLVVYGLTISRFLFSEVLQNSQPFSLILKFDGQNYLISLVILMVLLFVLTQAFNAATVKRLHPKDYVSWYRFTSVDINQKIELGLERYLRKQKWNDQQIDKVQSLLTASAEKEQKRFIVSFSVFAALFIPLWAAYLEAVFGCETFGIADFHKIFVVTILLTAVSSLLIAQVVDLKDRVFTDFVHLNNLNKMITEFKIKKSLPRRN